MDFKKLFMVLVLSCGVSFAGNVNFPYEKDLVFMFENPKMFSYENKMLLYNLTAGWVKTVLDKHATGKVVLKNEDYEYIARLSYLACEMMNEHYEKSDLEEIFEK